MDELTRGLAEPPLLQAVLQAMIQRGVLNRNDALHAIDICIDAAIAHAAGNSAAQAVAATARSYLEDVRECVVAVADGPLTQQ